MQVKHIMFSDTQGTPKANWKLSPQDQTSLNSRGRMWHRHSMPTADVLLFQLQEITHFKDNKVLRIHELKQYRSILTEAMMQ